MRTCLLSGDWKKAYKMSEFQSLRAVTLRTVPEYSFNDLKFRKAVPNSVLMNSFSAFRTVALNSGTGDSFSARSSLRQPLTTLLFIIVLLIGLGNPGVILAQDTSDDYGLEEALSGFEVEASAEEDDLLSGFDDENDENGTDEEESRERTLLSFSGSAGLSASYSYAKDAPADKTQADWSGLTKLRPYFSLTWDAKLGENWKTRISGKAFYDLSYGMKDSETFSDEVLSELEKEAELREIYLEGSPFGNLDIKLGKQIVSWGVANSLRVVDVLNPTDDREFGMTDLEDIRLPINMTKLDYYIGDLKLEAVAVHEIKFNKSAPFGSDFNPSTQKINEVIPESSAENTEYGLALIGTFSGWDASLHWAQYFDDTAHFKITKVTFIPGLGAVPTLEQRHSRLTMGGATLSIPSGNFIWKAEAAKLQGMEFALVTDKTFSRTDVLVGSEYSGWSDTSLTLEFGVQHLNDFDVKLEESPDSQLEDRIATTVSFMQDYINQTLHLSLVGMMIGKSGKDGGLNRMSLEYDVMDAFSVTGGVMLYQPGENAYFQNLNENDRIFFEVRYSF
jgi:hypothetical protein